VSGDFCDGEFYPSHICGCTPDRVIGLATLCHRGIRGEIIMDKMGGSTSKVSVQRSRPTGGNRHGENPLHRNKPDSHSQSWRRHCIILDI
jgi:hypothetical protein